MSPFQIVKFKWLPCLLMLAQHLLELPSIVQVLEELLIVSQWVERLSELHDLRLGLRVDILKAVVVNVHHLRGVTRLIECFVVQSFLCFNNTW